MFRYDTQWPYAMGNETVNATLFISNVFSIRMIWQSRQEKYVEIYKMSQIRISGNRESKYCGDISY